MILLLCALAGVARADEEADRLFFEGRALVKAGRVAEACERFQASQRLEPAFGTLINIGDCSERLGRTATGWRAFRAAAALARRDGRPDRVALAEDRVAALAPRLSYLRVAVPESAGAVTVLVDGSAAAPREPVDPGRHLVEVRMPGRPPWQETVEVTTAGESVVALRPIDAGVAAPVPVAEDPGRGRRVLALALGGAGVAAIGVGAFFGVRAFSRWSDAEDECGALGCSQRGVTLGDDARADARVADVLIGAGIVAAGAAAVLWLTAPKAERRGVTLLPAPGGMAAIVRF